MQSHAYVAIVSLLTANAIAVHAMVLPMLSARAGRRLFDIDRPGFMTALSFVGAVSVVSWFAPFFRRARRLRPPLPMGISSGCVA